MGRIVARVKEQGIRQQIYEDEIRSDCFGGAAARLRDWGEVWDAGDSELAGEFRANPNPLG